jgi:hypothetical protein
MKTAFPSSFAAVLLIWEATAFLSRDATTTGCGMRVRRSRVRTSPAPTFTMKADQSRSSLTKGQQRKWRSRASNSPSRSTHFDSLLDGKSSDEIDGWMKEQVQGVISDTNNTKTTQLALPLFQNQWSSRQEVEFIRCLGGRQACTAVLLFVKHLARQTVFCYTAAIASLANAASMSDEYREVSSLQLLDEMQQNHVIPNGFTYSALFQAVRGPAQARALYERLQRDYPACDCDGAAYWTPQVWEAAIYACSRGQASWAAAEQFLQGMMTEEIAPTARTYLALFQVCVNTGNVSKAMSLLQELLVADNRDDSQAVVLTPHIWGAALQVCVAGSAPQSAREILGWMREGGYHANVRHCTTYLKALAATKQVETALNFLDYMNQSSNDDESSIWKGLSVAPPDRIVIQTVLTLSWVRACFFHEVALVD